MDMSWLPQEYANIFYWIKGAVAVAAIIMLLLHMYTARKEVTFARWMRYITLLYFSMLVMFSSLEQIIDRSVPSYTNLAEMVGVIILIFTVWVSITERQHDQAEIAKEELRKKMLGED